MVILDTCVLLWLASDQSKLSLGANKAIKAHSNALFVSAITGFEIAVKCREKKLTIPLPALDWFAEVLDFHGVRELPVTARIAMASVQLPRRHHDPCDRIIIATAAINGMKIISSDRLLSQYEQAEIIW